MRNLKNDKNAAVLTVTNLLSLLIVVEGDWVLYQWSDNNEVDGETELDYLVETGEPCFDIEGGTYELSEFMKLDY